MRYRYQAHRLAWWERFATAHADAADAAMTLLGAVVIGIAFGYFGAHLAIALLRAAGVMD